LGFDVHISVTSSTLPYRFDRQWHHKTSLPVSKVIPYPFNFISGLTAPPNKEQGHPLPQRQLRSLKPFLKSPKRLWKSLSYRLYRQLENIRRKNPDIRKIFAKSNLIIVGALPSADECVRLRQLTRAKLLYNHAGSPHAFEKFWITEAAVGNPGLTPSQKYSRFCQQFDGLLFQAPDQASECISRNASLEPFCHVLRPSCKEFAVLRAKQLPSPFPPDKKNIVCVGSLQPRKAQHLAIEAFALVAGTNSDVQLHFVGGGIGRPYHGELVAQVSQLGLVERVFFHGWREDYLAYMVHADCLVQSSEAEGVSRVLREAMLMKLPIISFAISGTASLLQSDHEALLIPPYDTQAMAEGLIRLLDDKAVGKQLAEAAYQRYLIQNSRIAYAGNLLMLIEKLTQPPPNLS